MPSRGLASRLNRRVTLENPARVANGQGGWTKGWASPVGLWAEAIPLRGGEAMQHNLVTAQQLWRVTVRFRRDVTTESRITLGGNVLNVRTCEDPDGRREMLVMTCESGVRN